MSQVLRNVISNAIKFSHAGGDVNVNLRVIDAESDPHSPMVHFGRNSVANGYETSELLYRIEVIDQGYGISPENLKKLFREVIQFEAKAQQGGGGSGLGLWISKKIVDLHHGKIEARSEGLGHGCTFYIEIPLIDSATQPSYLPNHREPAMAVAEQSRAEVEPSALDPPLSALPGAVSSASHRSRTTVRVKNPPMPSIPGSTKMTEKYRLLVVDDSGPTRKMACQMLQLDGHNCTQAFDGINAIKEYKECLQNGLIFDAILMVIANSYFT